MPAAKSDTPKTTRVTKVQVPGETAPTSPSSEEAKAEVSTATTLPAADNPATGTDVGQGAGVAGDPPAAGPSAEEVAALQAENEELRAQIAAAGRAPAAGHKTAPIKSRADYLTMRSKDIDPKTLTKAVLSADGWVCPPQIAQAQPK